MERLGPESLMLMAAAPIRARTARDERAMWEALADAEAPGPVPMLAVAPALARSGAARDRRGWWAHLRADP